MNQTRPPGPGSPPADGRDWSATTRLEGAGILPDPPPLSQKHQELLGVRRHELRGWLTDPQNRSLLFDDRLLSTHVLFLGAIGSGKTTAMIELLKTLRQNATADDVFVIFDTKGDFLKAVHRGGDAVISNEVPPVGDHVIWNLFCDLLERDPGQLQDAVSEIAASIFGESLERAGENTFFAAGACDIFTAVTEIMARGDERHSNQDLRQRLESSADDLQATLLDEPGYAGTARYLDEERTAQGILAFLQQTLSKSFSGAFGTAGDFSVRDFIRRKGGKALFVEYDIAVGSRLLPVYRVLLDMAIKEALSLGRKGARGNVYFVLDEFALLPALSHVADGINFGRSLNLKFIVATQNVSQVMHAYGQETGLSILSGFGTVFAFRLMDNVSRGLVRQRYGTNRKRITTMAAVRSEGMQQGWIDGYVIEDWDLDDLRTGHCVVSLPEGWPFFFRLPDPDRGRPS